MNRIIMWVMGTVTVMVLLFGYHTSTSGALVSQTSQLAPNQPAISSPADSSTSASGTTSGDSSGTSSGSTSTAKGSTSTTKAATFTGDNISTRWGPVQVQITVAQGQITGVDMLAYPYDNQRDQEINARALPILISETMDSQSAQIDMVSGATYTSDGYTRSLQSALDQAGL